MFPARLANGLRSQCRASLGVVSDLRLLSSQPLAAPTSHDTNEGKPMVDPTASLNVASRASMTAFEESDKFRSMIERSPSELSEEKSNDEYIKEANEIAYRKTRAKYDENGVPIIESVVKRNIAKLFQYGSPESKRIRQAAAIYRSIEAQSCWPAFHDLLQIRGEPNFINQHHMILIHVWLVHRRLLQEGKEGKRMQEILFDEFWEDTKWRIRAVGIPEITVGKQLSKVQSNSFTTMMQYDQGIKNIGDKNIDLGSALFYNLFRQNENIPHKTIFNTAKYLREETERLLEHPAEHVFNGKIRWGAPPLASKEENTSSSSEYYGKSEAEVKAETEQPTSPYKAIKLGDNNIHYSMEEEPEYTFGAEEGSSHRVNPMLSVPWRRARYADGRTYWWHVYSRKVQWEKPKERLMNIDI